MPYTQNWGISRNAFQSPLNYDDPAQASSREEDMPDIPVVDTDPNADESIIDQNNDKANTYYEGAYYKGASGRHGAEFNEEMKKRGFNVGGPEEQEPLFENEEEFKKAKRLSEIKETLNQLDPEREKEVLASNVGTAENAYSTGKSGEEYKTTVDNVQKSLDWVGMMFPPADVLNAGIYGARGTYGAITGGDKTSEHFKNMGRSAFYTIPLLGDTASATTKLGKVTGSINTLGKSKYAKLFGGSGSKGKLHVNPYTYKSKGTKVLTGEHSLGNVSRGLFNTMFRKGYNTKVQDVITKHGGWLGKKFSENFLSGKTGVKFGMNTEI